MSKAYMPFYVGDFLADTMHLGAAETGIYVRLILHCWQHHGTITRDDRQLAMIGRCDPRMWWKYRDTMLAFFDTVDASTMQHRKVVRLLLCYDEKAKHFKDRAVLAARAKHATSTQSESTYIHKKAKQGENGVQIETGKEANEPRGHPPSGLFWAHLDSPQYAAWKTYRAGQSKGTPLDQRGGWHFPTEWPPP